jgi:hypothetical protein
MSACLGRSIRTIALCTGVFLLAAAMAAPPAFAVADILDVHDGLPDLDRRQTEVGPTLDRRRLAHRIGTRVSWNGFGTPASLINHRGVLGSAAGDDAVTVARQWVGANKRLFGLSDAEVTGLEVLNEGRMPGSDAAAVLFRQGFGELAAGVDGLLAVGVDGNEIVYVSSSVAPNQGSPAEPQIDQVEAVIAATEGIAKGVTGSDIQAAGGEVDWMTYRVSGLPGTQRVREVAVPAAGGVRAAYEVLLISEITDGVPFGYQVFIDAGTGDLLVRRNLVDRLADNPRWKVFRNIPPIDFSSKDTRVVMCWQSIIEGKPVDGCDLEVKNPAAQLPWDVDPTNSQPTFTTKGNAASTALSSLSPFTPSDNYRPVSPEREYIYPWTNYWFEEKCPRQTFSPDLSRNDINAAIVNLFVMHNRLHDWSYELGFVEDNYNLQQSNFGSQGGREGDPEIGNAQAAVLTGGAPTFTGRDNANQITPNDGVSPITNMYLWQPLAGGFYPPCVDGDFDMSVIGHEYTHAISNRMVAGPDAGLSSRQGGSMGESWSDLTAMEYLFEHDYAPVGNENPYAVGPYVTGNKRKGIRNYGMNRSPLNYSDVGYDFVGAQVHADGEIWSATNFDIRKAMIKKYNKSFPVSDRSLQVRCAEGKEPASACPGNRRWMQIVFDAYLLMQSDVTMVDARDAYLAADKMRFDGANQKLIWNVFARRGFGERARPVVSGTTDDVAKPSFRSPRSAAEGTLRFRAVGAGRPVKTKIYVGRYQARVTPIADTIAKTKRTSGLKLMPGRYSFVARAKGFGMLRFNHKVSSRKSATLTLRLQKNLASKHAKAKIASGIGTPAGPPRALIDDTESTNWTFAGPVIKGAQVTVDLAGRSHVVRRVNVSAMLRPRNLVVGQGDPQDPSQNRFTALRSFKIQACKAAKVNKRCSSDLGFRTIFTSARDAFPAGVPRPLAPNLILRGFRVRPTRATHVRLVVVTNQCTGTPAYKGESDNDATNVTDCPTGSAQDEQVRAAELQVFSRRGRVIR